MGQHPAVLQAMHEALETFGAGAGGTRNISGNHRLIVALEHELADLHEKEAGLVFSSGYVANETALSTLGQLLPNVMILSDSHNHASMIEGIKHSRADKRVFRHNDLEDLEAQLRAIDPCRPKLIAFESLYSMDGDFAPLREIVYLAKKYNALTFVDETHGVALYGARGGGVVEREGLLSEVDIIQGGLGKGFGVVGGFITGSREIIDVVRSYGAGFIFTTAIPPTVAAGALASIRHLKASQVERAQLFERVEKVRGRLLAANLPVKHTHSQILPLMVGDSALCQRTSDMLLDDYDIYIQPINYPTVPRGTERLRITPSPLHTDAMTEHLADSLVSIWAQLQLQAAA
jgi:5-aminolevulinate synthase